MVEHHYTAQAFDQLIQARFTGQAGWFCLGTIDGDPDIEKMKQEWYLLPRQRAELAERCTELAARNCNLYWAACKRSYAAALPSPGYGRMIHPPTWHAPN